MVRKVWKLEEKENDYFFIKIKSEIEYALNHLDKFNLKFSFPLFKQFLGYLLKILTGTTININLLKALLSILALYLYDDNNNLDQIQFFASYYDVSEEIKKEEVQKEIRSKV